MPAKKVQSKPHSRGAEDVNARRERKESSVIKKTRRKLLNKRKIKIKPSPLGGRNLRGKTGASRRREKGIKSRNGKIQ